MVTVTGVGVPAVKLSAIFDGVIENDWAGGVGADGELLELPPHAASPSMPVIKMYSRHRLT
jgi:hypothetical protein